MTLRLFLTVLMALALTLGSLAMPGGAAMAAPLVPHHDPVDAEAMGPGHCDEPQPAESQDGGGKAAKGCCVAGCVAVADLPGASLGSGTVPGLRLRLARDRFRLGYIGEIATPPPRTV